MAQNTAVHPIAARLASGGVALGINVQLARTEQIADIAHASGHDFLYVDLQHALFDLDTAGRIALAASARGVMPLARVRSPHDPNISVLLDNGYQGIVAPDVDSVDDARAVVNAAKFSPVGRRSLGGRLTSMSPVADPARLMQEVNAATLVICMIESSAGAAQMDEICAVDGVDGLYLGMTDLMVRLGKPGRPDDPEVVEILDRLIAVTGRHGKIAAAGGLGGHERERDAVRRGVQLINTQSDVGYVLEGAIARVAAFRGRAAGV